MKRAKKEDETNRPNSSRGNKTEKQTKQDSQKQDVQQDKLCSNTSQMKADQARR
jgi:hypothetical protein